MFTHVTSLLVYCRAQTLMPSATCGNRVPWASVAFRRVSLSKRISSVLLPARFWFRPHSLFRYRQRDAGTSSNSLCERPQHSLVGAVLPGAPVQVYYFFKTLAQLSANKPQYSCASSGCSVIALKHFRMPLERPGIRSTSRGLPEKACIPLELYAKTSLMGRNTVLA